MQSCICKTPPTGEYHTARTLQMVSRNRSPCYDLRDVPAIICPSESNTFTLRFCRRGGSRLAAIVSRIQKQSGTGTQYSVLTLTRFICINFVVGLQLQLQLKLEHFQVALA